MKRLHSILFFMTLLLLPGPATGQTVLQVVTKRIEKTFNYKAGYELNIEGEKATVKIDSWDRNEIRVQIELNAKHPDRSRAEADLEAMKYLADRVKNKIYLRNYISLKEGAEKPEAELSARYLITLPEHCPVYLKNYFGVSDVSNLSGGLRIRSEFSRVGLQNVSGEIDLTTRFGDLTGEKLDGNVLINSRRSDLTLRDLQGRYTIRAAYGTLNLYLTPGLADLDIQGEKTDVFLHGAELDQYSYALSARNGDIIFPQDIPLRYLENTTSLKRVQFTPKREYYANVTISITLGEISFKN